MMFTMRAFIRRFKDRKILQGPACVGHYPRFTSNSHPNSILADYDEQEDVEAEEDMEMHSAYPILGNRCSDLFYMPQCVGPAYQDLVTTADQFDLRKYYKSISWRRSVHPIKAQVVRCPKLLLPQLKDIFTIPRSRLRDPINFSILNLHFDSDVNSAIKTFVLIAARYSMEFIEDGYWSDFVNPFTGRAYFRPAYRRKLSKKDVRFLGNNMLFNEINGCTVIKEAKKCTFAGAIFTDLPVRYFD